MKNLFQYDNKFFSFLSKLVDLVFLNLLFILSCIPIITIGAAATSLFTVTLKMVRDEEGSIAANYFNAFKSNFKQSTIAWLIVACIGIILYIDTMFWVQQNSQIGKIMGVLTVSFVIIFSMIVSWLFPTLAKFDNTIRNTFKNAFLFGIKYLPTSFLVMFILLANIILPNIFPIFILIDLIVGFALMAYLQSILIRKKFEHHIIETK